MQDNWQLCVAPLVAFCTLASSPSFSPNVVSLWTILQDMATEKRGCRRKADDFWLSCTLHAAPSQSPLIPVSKLQWSLMIHYWARFSGLAATQVVVVPERVWCSFRLFPR